MADTVQLPGIGPVKKNTALIGGAVGIGLIVIMYVRSRNAKQNAANTYDPNAINPVTGYPYGSPQDTAALAALNAGSPPVTGSGGGGGVLDTTPPDTGNGGLPVFFSNAAWAQYAENYLVTNQNKDPGKVGAALGAYVTGEHISEGQRDEIVVPAIAIAGYPPVNGPAGFPPSMHVTPPVPNQPAAWHYAVENHPTGPHPQNGRGFIIALSDSGAPKDKIQVALKATADDPRNAVARKYFGAHGGNWPANTTLVTHVVKKG